VVIKVLDKCPGSRDIITPVPIYKRCPDCGEEVEVWSDELKAKCAECGTTVFREAVPSCIEWCQAAKECLGEERYNQIMEARKRPE